MCARLELHTQKFYEVEICDQQICDQEICDRSPDNLRDYPDQIIPAGSVVNTS